MNERANERHRTEKQQRKVYLKPLNMYLVSNFLHMIY